MGYVHCPCLSQSTPDRKRWVQSLMDNLSWHCRLWSSPRLQTQGPCLGKKEGDGAEALKPPPCSERVAQCATAVSKAFSVHGFQVPGTSLCSAQMAGRHLVHPEPQSHTDESVQRLSEGCDGHCPPHARWDVLEFTGRGRNTHGGGKKGRSPGLTSVTGQPLGSPRTQRRGSSLPGAAAETVLLVQ